MIMQMISVAGLPLYGDNVQVWSAALDLPAVRRASLGAILMLQGRLLDRNTPIGVSEAVSLQY